MYVRGADAVRRLPSGEVTAYAARSGRELVVDGRIVVPPIGVRQREYPAVLGTHRLYLGDAYGIHGTTEPASIGKAATHGCVRMRNEEIAALFALVPAGTPVYLL